MDRSPRSRRSPHLHRRQHPAGRCGHHCSSPGGWLKAPPAPAACAGGVYGEVRHVLSPSRGREPAKGDQGVAPVSLHPTRPTSVVRSAVSREQQVLAACARGRAPLLCRGASAPLQWQQAASLGARPRLRCGTERRGHCLWWSVLGKGNVCVDRNAPGSWTTVDARARATAPRVRLNPCLFPSRRRQHREGKPAAAVNGRQRLPGSWGVVRDGMLVGYSLPYELSWLVAGGRSRRCP